MLIPATFLLLSIISYSLGRKKANDAERRGSLHSRPGYYGIYVALWSFLPALAIYVAWVVAEPYLVKELIIKGLPESYKSLSPERLGLVFNDIRNMAEQTVFSRPDKAIQAAADEYLRIRAIARTALVAACFAFFTAGFQFGYKKIRPGFQARNRVEKAVEYFFIAASFIAVLTTVGIVLSVLFESLRFFRMVPITEFIFGLKWSPQIAIRSDQVGASGAFGMIPVFAGTLLITMVAMTVAVPVGLFSAIYLCEFASKRMRAMIKPMLEILAGIPTVVYGFFAALTVGPFIRQAGDILGFQVASESALSAGLVMGIMIIPFISSLSDDVINAVPQELRDGSYAMGATRAETIRHVVIPAALPGIVGGILLGVSRAIGETMIVVMAAGLSANLTANPLEAVTTVTVQIVTLLVGDQEFDSPKTLAAFALGLVLFVTTLCLNIIALYVVRKYREEYE